MGQDGGLSSITRVSDELEFVNLDFTKLADEDLIALARVEAPSLRSLGLRYNKRLGAAGLDAIQHAPWFPQFNRLTYPVWRAHEDDFLRAESPRGGPFVDVADLRRIRASVRTYRHPLAEESSVSTMALVHMAGETLRTVRGVFDLNGPEVNDTYMAHAVLYEHLGQLDEINVIWAPFVTGMSMQHVLTSPHMETMWSLSFVEAGVGDLGALFLARSPRFAQLQHLALIDANVTGGGIRALARSPHFPDGLRALDLSRQPLGDAGAASLCGLPHRVGRVAVTRAEIGPFGAATALACVNATRVELDDNPAAGLGAHLTQLSPQLEDIGLNRTGLTDDDVVALAKLPSKALRHLRIEGNPALGDRAIDAILAAPWFGQLETIWIAPDAATWRGRFRLQTAWGDRWGLSLAEKRSKTEAPPASAPAD